MNKLTLNEPAIINLNLFSFWLYLAFKSTSLSFNNNEVTIANQEDQLDTLNENVENLQTNDDLQNESLTTLEQIHSGNFVNESSHDQMSVSCHMLNSVN